MSSEKSYSMAVGEVWHLYAAGGPYDLTDGTNGPARCARRVVMLTAGDLTHCLDSKGVDRPLPGLPAIYTHDAHVASITPTAACVVYW